VDVCKPNLTLCATNPHLYIADIQCFGIDSDDGRASFPSGHSSDSFYVAIFCILYLQVRFDLRSALRYIRASFQLILFTIAYYCAMSRVMDNHHRGSDALSGSLLGTLIATSTVYLLANNFRHSRYHKRPTNDSDQEALLESGRQSDNRSSPLRHASSLLSVPKQSYGSIAQNEPPSDSGTSTI